jgi:hypothetical protein
MTGIDELLVAEEAASEVGRPATVAIGSSLKPVLCDEEKMVMPFPGLVGNEKLQ